MKSPLLLRQIVLPAILLAGMAYSDAAPIRWSSGVISSPLDVATESDTRLAVNFGSVLISDDGMKVNDVPFATSNLSSTKTVSSVTAGSLTIDIGNSGRGVNLTGTNSALPAGYMGLETNYGKMISSGIHLTGGNTGTANVANYFKLTFNDLIIGNTYLIQIWTNAATTTGIPAARMDMVFSNGSDAQDTATHTVSSNPESDLAGAPGSWITAEFTADARMMTIIAATDYRGMINAVQMRDLGVVPPASIPEPSVTAALLAGMIALALRRKA